MRPKEVQKILGIDADRIKLFKREGVFAPENPPSGNRGTNYTETDLENLRFLVVLTKSGLTCSDIRKMQEGECSLEEAIISRRKYIEDDIAKKRNSLSLLSELLDGKAEFESFDTDHYWDIITQREAEGEEFIDVEDMYGYRPVSLIRNIQCPYCGEVLEIDLEDFQYDQSSDERENGMGPDIMALQADPSIPATIDEWLDRFDIFSIYQVLPQILELWGENLMTEVEAKKELAEVNGR